MQFIQDLYRGFRLTEVPSYRGFTVIEVKLS
jgi:hypothetical protein